MGLICISAGRPSAEHLYPFWGLLDSIVQLMRIALLPDRSLPVSISVETVEDFFFEAASHVGTVPLSLHQRSCEGFFGGASFFVVFLLIRAANAHTRDCIS